MFCMTCSRKAHQVAVTVATFPKTRTSSSWIVTLMEPCTGIQEVLNHIQDSHLDLIPLRSGKKCPLGQTVTCQPHPLTGQGWTEALLKGLQATDLLWISTLWICHLRTGRQLTDLQLADPLRIGPLKTGLLMAGLHSDQSASSKATSKHMSMSMANLSRAHP